MLQWLVLVAVGDLLHLPDHLVELLLLVAALLPHHLDGLLPSRDVVAIWMQEELPNVVTVGDHLRNITS